MAGTPWLGDACSLVDAFRAKELSPVEALDAALAAIEKSKVNAFSYVHATEARRATAGWLGDKVAMEQRHDALLVVSELVTNAYEHGTGKIELKLRIVDDELQVEVTDEGRGAAVGIREHDIDEGGLGLRIVDQLANRWGVYEGTTHVWAKLPRG